MVRRYSELDEAFYRHLILPEEQRQLLTVAKWDGSFRWFQSPNVIPFEKYRRPGPADRNQRVASQARQTRAPDSVLQGRTDSCSH